MSLTLICDLLKEGSTELDRAPWPFLFPSITQRTVVRPNAFMRSLIESKAHKKQLTTPDSEDKGRSDNQVRSPSPFPPLPRPDIIACSADVDGECIC